MRFWRRLLRILGYTCLATLILLLTVAATIKAQQYLLRYRASRLLADYETLHLGRTTWPEAQQFIHRWQHWGYASPTCNSDDCSYTIVVGDTFSMHLSQFSDRVWRRIEVSHIFPSLGHLGFRPGDIVARITVIHGVLLSDQISVLVDVPDGDGSYGLSVSARSRPNLRADQNNFTYDKQMTDHPDYFVGRPGGCEGCMVSWVDFTPALSDKQHAQLTDFQLDCFTRRNPCLYPKDLLPAMTPYHLYEETNDSSRPPNGIQGCSVLPNTLGRDAESVLVVDAVSKTSFKLSEEDSLGFRDAEHVTASRIETLKGKLPSQFPITMTVMPFPGRRDDYFGFAPEHMTPGFRYMLVGSELAFGSDVLGLDHCGVILDTPQNRRLVMDGISQDMQFQSPKVDPLLEPF